MEKGPVSGLVIKWEKESARVYQLAIDCENRGMRESAAMNHAEKATLMCCASELKKALETK